MHQTAQIHSDDLLWSSALFYCDSLLIWPLCTLDGLEMNVMFPCSLLFSSALLLLLELTKLTFLFFL